MSDGWALSQSAWPFVWKLDDEHDGPGVDSRVPRISGTELASADDCKVGTGTDAGDPGRIEKRVEQP
jgi:hypothetical protein